MGIMQQATIEIDRMEHAERTREAERFRRAREAQANAGLPSAAPRERRFTFFRIRFARLREA